MPAELLPPADAVNELTGKLGGNRAAATTMLLHPDLCNRMAQVGRENERKRLDERLKVLEAALQQARRALSAARTVQRHMMDEPGHVERTAKTATWDSVVAQLTADIAADEAELTALQAAIASASASLPAATDSVNPGGLL